MAGFYQGDHVVKGQLGVIDGIGNYDDLARLGVNGELSYRFYFQKTLSIGAHVQGYEFGERDLAGGEKVNISGFSTAWVFRLDLTPTREAVSYFSAGPTINVISTKIFEQTGSRSEETTQGGYFIAFGFDREWKNHWFWGVEGIYLDAISVKLRALGVRASLSRRWGKTGNQDDIDYFE